jgi:hypothetical protein
MIKMSVNILNADKIIEWELYQLKFNRIDYLKLPVITH